MYKTKTPLLGTREGFKKLRTVLIDREYPPTKGTAEFLCNVSSYAARHGGYITPRQLEAVNKVYSSYLEGKEEFLVGKQITPFFKARVERYRGQVSEALKGIRELAGDHFCSGSQPTYNLSTLSATVNKINKGEPYSNRDFNPFRRALENMGKRGIQTSDLEERLTNLRTLLDWDKAKEDWITSKEMVNSL